MVGYCSRAATIRGAASIRINVVYLCNQFNCSVSGLSLSLSLIVLHIPTDHTRYPGR